MSVEDQQLLDQIEDLPYQTLKFQYQNTAISFKQKNNCQSAFDFESYLQSSTDCSFQQGIHEENTQILKNATVRYLEESLAGGFDRSEGFKDASLYHNLPFEVGGQNELELLTVHNELLSEQEKQELLVILKEEEDLVGFIGQTPKKFGITVGKQLVYVLLHLLRLKLPAYRQMTNIKETILPRFSCFQGFDQEELPFNTSCPVYEDINLEEISPFAEKQLEDLSSSLYFSSQLKYLNLREIEPDTKGDVLQKFKALMKQISRTIFYTIAGAVQPSSMAGSSLFSVDLSREVSFSEFPEGNILSIQRSLSRPFVPCEDEQQDFLRKRLKFDKTD